MNWKYFGKKRSWPIEVLSESQGSNLISCVASVENMPTEIKVFIWPYLRMTFVSMSPLRTLSCQKGATRPRCCGEWYEYWNLEIKENETHLALKRQNILFVSKLKYFSIFFDRTGARGSWLRHYVTSRKVAGSNTDEVIGFWNWTNPSSSTVALRST
jgi:hypothetical protein